MNGKKPGTTTLARSSAIMFSGTLASRILGLVRNAILVVALGATGSGAADAFNTANNAPTQIYNLLAAGVLNAILVPQIVRALRQKNGDEQVNRLLTAAGTVLLGATVLVTVAAPLVVMIYASQLGQWRGLAIAFAFWCLPQIFFYGLYALWGQVLNARSSFGPYMWSPVLNNVISIVSLLAYLHIYGQYTSGQSPGEWTGARIALMGGTATLGIALQAVVLVVPLVRSGFRPRLVWGVRGMGLGRVSRVAMWALLGVAVVEIATPVTTTLGSAAMTASSLPQYADVIVPSTTMYNNALMVYMLPQSLVTTSIIIALFTRMSQKAAAEDAEGVRDDLSLGLRSVAVFTVLFSAGIAVLAVPALQVFVPSLSLAQAQASGVILTVLALGIVPQGIWSTSQRVMLAYEDTKRLLLADIPVGVVPVVVCATAYLVAPANHWMAWAAAGSVASQVTGSAVIMVLLRKHLPDLDGPHLVRTHLSLVGCVLPAVGIGLLLTRLLGPADAASASARMSHALLTVVVVALAMTVVYVLLAKLLRVPELAVLLRPVASVLRRVGGSLPGALGRVVAGGAATRVQPAPQPAPGLTVGADDGAPATAPAPPPPPPATSPAGTPGTTRGAATTNASVHPAPVHPATMGGLTVSGATRGGRTVHVDEGTPIGSGRYRLLGTMPTTLPRIVRHRGRDTILDREVTVLTLTDATPHRGAVLEAATRAVLIEDPRILRVLDVETGATPFIVTEASVGTTYGTLVERGLAPDQVRAVIGEAAQALDAASRRGLHHLALGPDSLRVTADGVVKVAGVGIEAALRGGAPRSAVGGPGRGELSAGGRDPLAADRTDARALVELLYYGLTRRWPGKRAGIPAAPVQAGHPLMPSRLAPDVDPALDELCGRTWAGTPPISAAEVASALSPWAGVAAVQAPTTPAPPDTRPGPSGTHPGASAPSSGNTQGLGAVAGVATGVVAGVAGTAGRLLARLRRRGAGSASPPAAAPVGSPAAGPVGSPAAGSTPVTAVAPSSTRPDPSGGGGQRMTPAPQPGASRSDGHEDDPGLMAQVGERIDDVEEETESRRVSRTTSVVLVGLMLAVLVGVVLAVSNLLQLAGVRLTDTEVPAAKTVPTVAATEADTGSPGTSPGAPIVITGAQSLDPYGDDNEHPELAPTLIDGNPGTVWFSRYYASSSLAYKQGIGVAVSLEQATTVSSIEIQGTGTGGNVQVRATSPEDPTGGTLLAEGPFTSGTTTFTFTGTQTASIVLWVTDLPTAEDGLNKVTISEITLK